MSFFSDLFKGNFGNLGRDITHAPSSFVRDWSSEWPYVAAAGAAAIPFVGPEIAAGLGGLAGGADLLGGAAAGGDLAASLGIGDIGGAAAADLAAGGATAADLAAASDPLAFASATAADPFAPGAGLDLTGGTGLSSAAADTAAASDVGTIQDLAGGFNPAAGATDQAMAAGGAAPATGGGFTLPSWAKYAAGAAPLALTLARGEPSLPAGINPAAANATALAQGGSALNPSQNSVLTQMRQDSINAARQALFNQGVTNPEADSRWPQYIAQIDSQVSAAAQQMIQQNIQNSLAGDQQLIQIAQLQMQSDQAFTNNLVRATAALGTAAGLGGGLKLVQA